MAEPSTNWLSSLFDRTETVVLSGLSLVLTGAIGGVWKVFGRLEKVEEDVRALKQAKLMRDRELDAIKEKLADVPTRGEMFARLDESDRRQAQIITLLQQRGERS